MCAPDDGQRYSPKHVESYFKNKFEKLVLLFGFIIRMYHYAQSSECQILNCVTSQMAVIWSIYINYKADIHNKMEFIFIFWNTTLYELNIKRYESYSLIAMRIPGTTRAAPCSLWTFPTIRIPNKKRAVAENAEPRTCHQYKVHMSWYLETLV